MNRINPRTVCLLLFAGVYCLAGCSGSSSYKQETSKEMINWTKLPDLPGPADTLSLGVSAPFAGVHKAHLLVAGGCNFPDKPVTEGGTKRYYSEIFVLPLQASGVDSVWREAGKLPWPVAYGASVQTPEGVICLGGNNADASLTEVTRLSWNPETEEVDLCALPALPAAMDNLAATLCGNQLYVAGGNENGQGCNRFLSLDLSALEKGWQTRPSFPGSARIQPVLTAALSPHGEKVYLTGGFQPSEGGEKPVVPSDMLAYCPVSNTWSVETELPRLADGQLRSLTGGCGVRLSDSLLLFVGGVNRDLFYAALDRPRQIALAKASDDTERLDSLQASAKQYMLHPVEWYAFNTSLLQYNTRSGEWTHRGDYEQLARAGAGAVVFENALIIINGELKPGVRTPQVNKAEL